MEYTRLTDKKHRYKKCANCTYKNCQYCDDYINYENECHNRLVELEDKIENGSLREAPEGSVVLSEGEYSNIIENEIKTLRRDIAEYWAYSDIDAVAQELHKDGYRKIDDHAIITLRKSKGLEVRTRKETAKEILKYIIESGVINIAPQTIRMYFKENYGVEE